MDHIDNIACGLLNSRLHGPDNTFSPGEMVAGQLIVDLGRTKSIRGLKVRIKGSAEVKWSESSKSGKGSSTTWYSGNEQYFRTEYYLLGASGNSENIDIQSGHHEFPFNFCLPHNIPSSFEHKDGSVRYTIKAVMDRPWKFDHQTTMSFTVENPYDITQCPPALEVIDDEGVKTFCCFPCINMGSMRVHVYVPTSGFAVGDAIEAKVDIDNNSRSVEVTKVKLRMQQKIKLHAQFPTSKTKKHNNTIHKTGKTGPFSKTAEVMMNMQVPVVPPSNLSHCSLIDIQYRLNVEISVSGCHCSTTKSYPIIIGTRPALNFQPMRNSYVVPRVTQRPPSFGLVQANIPTAPFYTAETPIPVGMIPFPMPMTDQQLTNPIPYGLEPPNQTYPPPMPGLSTSLGFQYPPAMNPAIGFVHPSLIHTTTSTEFTAKPPPSYDACMRMGENK